MLSEEDFVKMNENIHTRLNAASSIAQKIIEKPAHEEEAASENDDECAVILTTRNPNKTPTQQKESPYECGGSKMDVVR
jgi:hypothetical protein